MLARRGHSQSALQSDKKLQEIHSINHFSTASDLTPTASMMGQISPLLQLPSPPAGSYNNYLYADPDHYIDAQTSASQSPINSQVRPFFVRQPSKSKTCRHAVKGPFVLTCE